MQIFQPRKNKTFSKQNDFELDYIFSSFKTAISYWRDFNLTKFSNAILNFVYILPAWILFISLCFPDFPVLSRLLPENRINKNCIGNKPKCGNKRVNEEQRIHSELLVHERALTSTRQSLTKKRNFHKGSQNSRRKNRYEPSVSYGSWTS